MEGMVADLNSNLEYILGICRLKRLRTAFKDEEVGERVHHTVPLKLSNVYAWAIPVNRRDEGTELLPAQTPLPQNVQYVYGSLKYLMVTAKLSARMKTHCLTWKSWYRFTIRRRPSTSAS
jgi:hypothetical protein